MMSKKFQFLLFLYGGLTLTSIPPPTSGVEINPDLQKKIDSSPVGTTWSITILFKQDPTILPSPPEPSPDVEEASVSAYNTMEKLKKFAGESQSSVIAEIKSFIAGRSSTGSSTNVKIQQTWCNNGATVTPADRDLIYHIADDKKPGHQNITMIAENEKWVLGKNEEEGSAEAPDPGESTQQPFWEAWGVKKIKAEAWWKGGYTGAGVLIGHIDSGVDINHYSLRWNWLGKPEGWKDPVDSNSKVPYESNPGRSHGTATLGIAVGRGKVMHENQTDSNFFGVGVAPGAKWMSCMGCKDNPSTKEVECISYNILHCLQYLYCPNDKNRCLYRPNIITVSLGCEQNQTHKCSRGQIMDPCIHALRSHGVIPVYAAGNWGQSGCQTLDDPADMEEVISVGNIDKREIQAPKSSMGPPEHRYKLQDINARSIFKPDFAAPGTNIYTTVYAGKLGTFKYGYKTGTSYAAPHVAGAVALLLSRSADLTFQNITEILRSSAKPTKELIYNNPRLVCGGKQDGAGGPDHKFGFGRLQLPDPSSPIVTKYPIKAPARRIPPAPPLPPQPQQPPPNPPENASPSVRPGMVGVVLMMMASTGFLRGTLMDI